MASMVFSYINGVLFEKKKILQMPKKASNLKGPADAFTDFIQ